MGKCKIIIDTNLWISLLIGKRVSELRSLCNSNTVSVYICEELKAEFVRIASREKIRKYATEEHILQTLELMETSCIAGTVRNIAVLSELRDVNDLYLLAFAETIQADYILTGDKDLLVLQQHRQTKIVTFNEFMAIYKS
ncbi:MAG: putative toxin-antitoxin system toxin component, PIN family [Prevotellaceae bacterium]|jgi:putative PIN family toxin of toxin-antitoxin system|nr:putative toxin-antitoxin system toxin component, PIN family [Prevotellaceae bacterium]